MSPHNPVYGTLTALTLTTGAQEQHHRPRPINHRFNLAWLLPLLIGAAAGYSPWAAWAAMLFFLLALAGLERLLAIGNSPAVLAPGIAVGRAVGR